MNKSLKRWKIHVAGGVEPRPYAKMRVCRGAPHSSYRLSTIFRKKVDAWCKNI